MFGIGSSELLVILVVALIVLGPKSLANVSRTLGKAMGEFRKVSTEFQRTLNTEIELEEHEKRKQEAEKELFGTEQKATAATKPAEAASPAAKPAAEADYQALAQQFFTLSQRQSPLAYQQMLAEKLLSGQGDAEYQKLVALLKPHVPKDSVATLMYAAAKSAPKP